MIPYPAFGCLSSPGCQFNGGGGVGVGGELEPGDQNDACGSTRDSISLS